MSGAANERRCKACGERKTLDKFMPGAWDPSNAGSALRFRFCLQCLEGNKRVTLPDIDISKLESKGKAIESTYGITLKEYEKLYFYQSGLCAICHKPETAKGRIFLTVDHDHKTGKVRGLLCSKCNAAIGLLEDSCINLSSAVRYLSKYSSKSSRRKDIEFLPGVITKFASHALQIEKEN